MKKKGLMTLTTGGQFVAKAGKEQRNTSSPGLQVSML